jgi:hypothetical protein
MVFNIFGAPSSSYQHAVRRGGTPGRGAIGLAERKKVFLFEKKEAKNF